MTQNYKNHQETSNKKSFISGFMNILKQNKVRQTYKNLDWLIIGITASIVIIGFLMVLSAMMYNNPVNAGITQLLSIIIGIILMNLILILPYEFFEDYRVLLAGMAGVIGLLIITAIYAEVLSGAQSWIDILGFSFQPSELLKILTILIVSWLINYVEREEILSLKTVPRKIIVFFIIPLIIALILILRQPDFGMVAIILGTVWLMVLLIKGSLKANIVSYTAVIVGYSAVVLFGRNYGDWLVDQNYHFFERIAAFVSPFSYSHSPGYQLIQGFLAFSRGGLWGVGFGQGVAKEGLLPAIESDFILAHIGEELGLIGVILVLGLFLALIILLYQRAASSEHIFRRSVITGVASLLLVQMFINVAGVASILPLTGVTLPLVSHGGTSMIVMLSALGLALRMIAEDRKEPSLSLVYSRKEGRSRQSEIN